MKTRRVPRMVHDEEGGDEEDEVGDGGRMRVITSKTGSPGLRWEGGGDDERIRRR